MSLVKNSDSFTGMNTNSALSVRNLNMPIGIDQTEVIDSDDYALRIMEETLINMKKKALTFKHKDNVNSVAFSCDGNYIASGSDDKSIKIWNVTNPKEIFTLIGIPIDAIYFRSPNEIIWKEICQMFHK